MLIVHLLVWLVLRFFLLSFAPFPIFFFREYLRYRRRRQSEGKSYSWLHFHITANIFLGNPGDWDGTSSARKWLFGLVHTCLFIALWMWAFGDACST